MLLADKDAKSANPIIKNHLSMEKNLVKYAGLILYMKELDEDRYQKLCAVSSTFDCLFVASSRSTR